MIRIKKLNMKNMDAHPDALPFDQIDINKGKTIKARKAIQVCERCGQQQNKLHVINMFCLCDHCATITIRRW